MVADATKVRSTLSQNQPKIRILRDLFRYLPLFEPGNHARQLVEMLFLSKLITQRSVVQIHPPQPIPSITYSHPIPSVGTNWDQNLSVSRCHRHRRRGCQQFPEACRDLAAVSETTCVYFIVVRASE
jgi:hypothetical protein